MPEDFGSLIWLWITGFFAWLFTCLNIANVLYTICYVVKDVLLLRILAIVAMIVILPHHEINNGDRTATVWNLLFIAINLFWVIMMLRERKPPVLTAELARLYELTFRACTKRQMLKLLEFGEKRVATRGEQLIEQGKTDAGLMLIHDGRAAVLDGNKPFAYVSDGDFVGEMSYLNGIPTASTVVAKGSVRYTYWSAEAMDAMYRNQPELESAIRNAISNNLVIKMQVMIGRVPELSQSLQLMGSQVASES